jgi:hypothetical protein
VPFCVLLYSTKNKLVHFLTLVSSSAAWRAGPWGEKSDGKRKPTLLPFSPIPFSPAHANHTMPDTIRVIVKTLRPSEHVLSLPPSVR